MITPHLYPHGGGLGCHVYYLSRNLSQLGYDVEIFTTQSFRRESIGMGLSGVKIDKSLRLFSIFNSPITLGLFRKISKIDADIIHAHGYFHYTTLLTAIFSAVRKKPFLITTHGSWVAAPYKLGMQSFYDSLARFSFSKAHKVLIHTFHEKERLQNAGFPSNKLEVIYNGVDLEQFNPNRNGASFRKRLNVSPIASMILFVGRLIPRKGCNILIEALPKILRRHPNVCLIIAGEGSEKLKLRSLTATSNLNDNVLFTGAVSQKDLPLLYAASDVVAIPSLRGEGFPLVLLEAMASQKPIVASEVGGIPEILKMTNAGLLVPPNDSDKLADTIVQMLENREQTSRLASNGRHWVEKRFNWKTLVEYVSKLYIEALQHA